MGNSEAEIIADQINSLLDELAAIVELLTRTIVDNSTKLGDAISTNEGGSLE